MGEPVVVASALGTVGGALGIFWLGVLRGRRVIARRCPCRPAPGVTCIHGKMGGRDA